MEWSIQQVAKLAGTTSRTLRHYHRVGLLEPSRVGANGYRHYDSEALVRLQRILLLREMGVGLATIREMLDGERDHARALRGHLAALREERARLEACITSVERTITRLERGEEPMADEMFDGFDHGAHRTEVSERWGEAAWEAGDRWWSGMTREDRMRWKEETKALSEAWADAARRAVDPGSAEAQALARRHITWLGSIPGTPRDGDRPARGYLLGLADLYVEDPRFAANYGGAEGARFVRAALQAALATGS